MMSEDQGSFDWAVHWRSDTIQSNFDRFHGAHPDVYRQLVDLTRQAKQAGRKRIGMKMLFEVLRWQRILDPTLPDPLEDFKLNNSYTSRYSRLVMDNNPDLDGMFELRELKT